MPGMLGRILPPVQPFAGEEGLPEHALELADLRHEPHLLIEPLHQTFLIMDITGCLTALYCGPSPSTCISTRSATNPTRMAVPLARERSRRRRSPGAAGRAGPGRPRPGDPGGRRDTAGFGDPGGTGLRSLLARRDNCQCSDLRRRRAARLDRSAADGSRNFAAPALPEYKSRSCRSNSSGLAVPSLCSVDMHASMPGGRPAQVGTRLNAG